MAGDITLREYEDWVHPADALKRAIERFGQRSAIRHLWDALEEGRLQGVAETHQDSTLNHAQRFVFIPIAHWREVGRQGPESFFWPMADLTVSPSLTTYSMKVIDYQGIRFNPRQLEKLIGVPVLQPTTEPKAKGGAPRKEFWDDLWIAIFAQLWDGKLKPTTQSDIERAMLDWAERRGEKLGETTVKKPAQKLFKAYKTWV